MNYSTAVFLINDAVRAVRCTYEEGDKAPRETFKTFDGTIMPGDIVVVPTNTRHNRTCVKVMEVDVEVDFDCATEMKWIIGKVDQSAYTTLLAQEGEAITKMKSAQRAKQRRELAAAMMADTEELKTLSISTIGVASPVEVS